MGRKSIAFENLNKAIWKGYYNHVLSDFHELKIEYPFSYIVIYPTASPSLLAVKVIAVNKTIIDAVNGMPEDFSGEYSKAVYMEIPLLYNKEGIKLYGGKWIDESKFRPKDVHLFHSNNRLIENKYGFQMCIGIPKSFMSMKNVLLEAVKTADNMLVAYERVQCGLSDRVILNAYSHGELGKKEYLTDKKRYVPRENAYGINT